MLVCEIWASELVKLILFFFFSQCPFEGYLVPGGLVSRVITRLISLAYVTVQSYSTWYRLPRPLLSVRARSWHFFGGWWKS